MSFFIKCISLLLVLCAAVWSLTLGINAERQKDIYVGSLSVSAQAAVLMDASDGTVFYSKNGAEKLPMASTTKIMTALVAIERGNLDTPYEIPSAAVGVEGSSVYLYSGEVLTLGELVYALMLESANDAATAIAINVAGSVDKFAVMMNEKAAELGLDDTHFTNPHGLDNDDHYTTAVDLAKLTAAALQNPTFRSIVSTRKKSIPLNGTEGVRMLINHNKMLRYYAGAIGVKTGFTKHSGRCLVSAAERDGLTFIAVTLNAPDDWNDHKKMLDYGFSSYVGICLAEAGAYKLSVPVIGGKDATVLCSNAERIRVTLSSSHGQISCRVEAPRFIWAPEKAGDTVGYLIYYCDGNVIGKSKLVTMSEVEATYEKRSFWKWLLSLLGLDE